MTNRRSWKNYLERDTLIDALAAELRISQAETAERERYSGIGITTESSAFSAN